jgi:hypothetical protein
LKPRHGEVRPEVEDDIALLLAGSVRMRDHAARGFTVAHDLWLRDGLPEELTERVRECNGFELSVIDAYGCTFLFGWRPRDKRLVLFAMIAVAREQSAEQIVERFVDRIEGYR